MQGESPNAPGVKYKGVLGTIATVAKTEGPQKLYSGLPAGIQRQISFASLRIGLYDSVQEYFNMQKESERGPQERGGRLTPLGSSLLSLEVTLTEPSG